MVGIPCADVNTAIVTQIKSLDQYKVAHYSHHESICNSI